MSFSSLEVMQAMALYKRVLHTSEVCDFISYDILIKICGLNQILREVYTTHELHMKWHAIEPVSHEFHTWIKVILNENHMNR